MWHYVRGEESVGPVSEENLATLIEEGSVRADTYVWREGFAEWKPLSEVAQWQDRMPSESRGLALRATPRDFKHNSEDESMAAISVEDLRAPLVEMAEAENADPDVGWFSWLVFLSPLEVKFFLATAMIAAGATVYCHFMEPMWVLAPFALQATLCMAFGGILFRRATWNVGFGWFIAGILTGVSDMVFLFLHWDHAKRPFLLSLAGIGVFVALIFLVPHATDLEALEAASGL